MGDNLFSFKCAIEQPYIKSDSPQPVERDILVEAYLQDELRIDPKLLCNTHFLLFLDISGSMDDLLEPNKNKLQAVVEAAGHVISGIKKGDLVSIITFTNKERVFCWAQPASVGEELRGKLHEIYRYQRGATNLAPALTVAREKLAELRGQKTEMATKLLILTDGEIHDVDNCEPLAREFQADGMDIDTVGIGADYYGEDMERLTSGFMEKLESSSETVAVFEKSLRNLQNTVATKVKVELDTMEGVEIRGIAKISPDIKIMAHDAKIISFENVDRNRRYAAVIRALIDPASLGEKAVLNATLSFDIPKKGLIDETIERLVAVHFTNDEQKYSSAPNSEVVHASTYYTVAIRAQEIQENSENKELIMRNLKLIINRLQKIGDTENMMRWQAIRDDYVRKGDFSLEEYNRVSVFKSKTSAAYFALPPPEVCVDELEDELFS